MGSKFYNFKNQSNNELDIYVYGTIVSGGNDWKWDETDVTFVDFREKLEGFSGNVINIYINSPGGSVFTTDGIIAMLKREKAKGKTINAFIDGLAASAASFLIMVADNIYVYQGSMMMIHRAMTYAYGNADNLSEVIGVLEKIEDGSIIPAYMSKVKDTFTEADIKEMMKAETWLTSSEIANIFNVVLMEDDKNVAAYTDKELFARYKNIPMNLRESSNKNHQHSSYNNNAVKKLKLQLELF